MSREWRGIDNRFEGLAFPVPVKSLNLGGI